MGSIPLRDRERQKKEEKKTHTHTLYIYIYIQWRRKVPKRVCVGGGGGGGANRYVIYVPSVKNQYKRVVFGYTVYGYLLTAICFSLLKLSTR